MMIVKVFFTDVAYYACNAMCACTIVVCLYDNMIGM